MKNIRENIKTMLVNQILVYHTLLGAYNIMRYSSSEQIHTKWTDRGWCIKFATELNIIIAIVQKAYE